MAAPDAPPADDAERQGRGGNPARGILERGLGKDFNIVVVAALLSLVVSFTTAVITSKIQSSNDLKEEQRRVEREAIISLQQAMLRETEAAVVVAAGSLPAKLPPVLGFDEDSVSPAVFEYLSAHREFEAAWGLVLDGRIRNAAKKVSDLTVRVVSAESSEDAHRHDLELALARQEAVRLMNDALRNV